MSKDLWFAEMERLMFRVGVIIAGTACGAAAVGLMIFIATTPAWPIALFIGPFFFGVMLMAIGMESKK